MIRLILRATLLIVLLIGPAQAEVPKLLHTYLTWSHPDTSTTMAVRYQTTVTREPTLLHYDTKPRDGEIAKYRFRATGQLRKMSFDPRLVHSIDLENLHPGQTYYFVVGTKDWALSSERKFRTIVARGPVRLVVGGDMGTGSKVIPLHKQAALQSPAAALIGGDIAFANGKKRKFRKWDTWLTYWEEYMVTPDGFMIPMILAIGNHEVRGGYEGSHKAAPFYFQYFNQDPNGQSYFARRFGANTILLVLDSSHVAPHDGAQTSWLKTQLALHKNTPNKFAIYHIPLYPSHRSYDFKYSALGRRYWLPLFDQFKLTTAFEHHDHALKRTKLLRNNKIARKGEGTLYLGDGPWGRSLRRPDRTRWYLEHAAREYHFWRVDIGEKEIRYRAVGLKGETIDQYSQPVSSSTPARKPKSSLR